MEISRTRPDTKRGPEEWFTGAVYMDFIALPEGSSRLRALSVHFTPGARTAWHTHPVGQTLYCLSGVGRYQREGEPVQALHPSDTVQIPPGVRHWHGAAPDRLFSHLAMSENNDKGEGTAWFEHVSDSDYAKPPAPVR
jgi:quercetin dioxygenase-like cupin family protein